jgi:hypothetical protein
MGVGVERDQLDTESSSTAHVVAWRRTALPISS